MPCSSELIKRSQRAKRACGERSGPTVDKVSQRQGSKFAASAPSGRTRGSQPALHRKTSSSSRSYVGRSRRVSSRLVVLFVLFFFSGISSKPTDAQPASQSVSRPLGRPVTSPVGAFLCSERRPQSVGRSVDRPSVRSSVRWWVTRRELEQKKFDGTLRGLIYMPHSGGVVGS